MTMKKIMVFAAVAFAHTESVVKISGRPAGERFYRNEIVRYEKLRKFVGGSPLFRA